MPGPDIQQGSGGITNTAHRAGRGTASSTPRSPDPSFVHEARSPRAVGRSVEVDAGEAAQLRLDVGKGLADLLAGKASFDDRALLEGRLNRFVRDHLGRAGNRDHAALTLTAWPSIENSPEDVVGFGITGVYLQ